MQVAELAHPPLLRAVAGQVFDLAQPIVVAGLLVLEEIAAAVETGVDEAGRQAHPGGPGEARRSHRLRIAEPAVATEQLVGAFTGDGHRGMPADLAEHQVQRGIHVAEGERYVLGPEYLFARSLADQFGIVDEHGAVTAADVLRGQQGERLVLVGTQVVAAELLGLADEVHRE